MPKKLTTEDFIEKAKAVHGDRYDYSQAVYKGSNIKVAILCPEHGVFKQAPASHIGGQGCSTCGVIKNTTKRILPLDEFLCRAKNAHGNKYDYSQVSYTTSYKKVTILCSEHGAFEQTPKSHMAGRGCQACAVISRTDNTCSFVIKSQGIHGNKYDYSQVLYSRSTDKVRIICPEHGAFEQTPNTHIKGRGCAACWTVKRSPKADKFVEKARVVHGNKYDYSQIAYAGASSVVNIICPIHGQFKQYAHAHFRGAGCPTCAHKYMTHSKERFIDLARTRHGDTYNYSQVSYRTSKTKVEIKCPIHGAFRQKPNSHLSGQGCPTCAQGNKRLDWIEQAKGKKSVLYFIKIFSEEEVFYKVGITFRSIEKRYSKRDLAAYQYEVLALHESTHAAAVWDWEQSILETFAHLAYKPKKYFAGKTECFSECDEILACFPV